MEAADLEATTDLLMDLATSAFVSLATGAAVGVVLRLTPLGTTSMLAAVPVVFVAALIHPLTAVWIGIAALTATALAGYRSYEELQKGGQSRRREQERRSLIGYGLDHWRESKARQNRISANQFALGGGRRGVCNVTLGSKTNGSHIFLPGMTGSGKTVTAATILDAQITSGAATFAVDPKDDGQLTETLRRAAERAGVEFIEVEPGRSEAGYNVAARGGDSEVAEKILSAHEWSEEHYRSVAQRFAQTTVGVIRACGVPLSLRTVGHYMHPDRLEALAASRNVATDQVATLISDLPRRMMEDLAGARSRIAQIAESDHGSWLDPQQKPPVDLGRAVKERSVVVFRLDSARYPEVTKLLAASLVLDLAGTSARMRSTDYRVAVFLDEFAELAAEKVSRLLATGRSSGMSIILAAQSLADLAAARGDETLIEQVLTNCDYTVAHQIPDSDSAERLAGLTGTYATWTQTEAYSMNPLAAPEARSKIPTREFKVHPDVFKELGVGEAVVIPRKGGEGAQKVRVWPAEGMFWVSTRQGVAGWRSRHA